MCKTFAHTYPGWPTNVGLKLELNAEAKPGSTGEVEGTPAAATAAAWRGATVATEEETPGSPKKEDSTGLPAAGGPEPPNPGKAGLCPGAKPGIMEGVVVSPRPKGEGEAAPVGSQYAMEGDGGTEETDECMEDCAPVRGEAVDSVGKGEMPWNAVAGLPPG